jgi:hypothetical protein
MLNKLKTIILIFLFQLISNSVFTQPEPVTLYGIVTNKSSKKVITGANIFLNKEFKANSDVNGNFKLILNRNNKVELSIKYSGLKSSEISIIPKDDSIFINVEMVEIETNLDTVTITLNSKPDIFVSIPNFEIIDYVIKNKYIVVAASRNQGLNTELFLFNIYGELIDSLLMPSEIGTLKYIYIDYTGHYIVVGEKNILKTGIHNNKFKIIYADLFIQYAYVKPVKDTIKGYLIFTDYNPYYSYMNYYLYNKKTKKQKKIISIGKLNKNDSTFYMQYRVPDSTEVETRIGLDINNFKFTSNSNQSNIKMNLQGLSLGNANLKIVNASSKESLNWFMKYKANYMFNPAPIFNINDTIFVFNMIDNIIESFNYEGSLIEKNEIAFIKESRIKSENIFLVKDSGENRVYLVNYNWKDCNLILINPKSGKVKGKIKLKGKFVKNVSVSDGYIYYISKDKKNSKFNYIYKEPVIYNQK